MFLDSLILFLIAYNNVCRKSPDADEYYGRTECIASLVKLCFWPFSGGQISFDAFPTGWDKTYCLRYLEKDYKVSKLEDSMNNFPNAAFYVGSIVAYSYEIMFLHIENIDITFWAASRFLLQWLFFVKYLVELRVIHHMEYEYE